MAILLPLYSYTCIVAVIVTNIPNWNDYALQDPWPASVQQLEKQEHGQKREL